MKPRPFARSAALALCLAASSLPAFAATPAADRFDAELAAGIPAEAFDLEYEGAIRRIEILEKVDADVDAPDGSSGAIYMARVDDRLATIVRFEDDLDIAFDEDAPVEPSGRRSRRSLGDEFGLAADLLKPSPKAEAREVHAPDDARALHVWIFLHETSGETNHAKFLNWYTGWWVTEMKKKVVPGMPIRISLVDRVPGLTDMNYDVGKPTQRLGELRFRGRVYAFDHGLRDQDLNLLVLAVDRPPSNWDGGVLGLSFNKENAAIFSNRGHRHNFAHEVGHLIGATHEDAGGPFYCLTSMQDNLIGRASCRYYSDANVENIRDYLRR